MNGKPAFPLRTAGFPIKVWIFKHIKNILNFDIMEMLHMNINVDQLLKELESVTITALDDNALCCLGLKLRMALIVMSQQEPPPAPPRQPFAPVR